MKVGDHVYHCIRDKFEVKVHDITESNLESAEFHVQEGAMHLTYEPAAKELLNYVNDEVSSTEQKFNEIQTKLIFLKEKQIEVNNLIQQTMTTELHNLGYRLIDIRKVPNKLMLSKYKRIFVLSVSSVENKSKALNTIKKYYPDSGLVSDEGEIIKVSDKVSL